MTGSIRCNKCGVAMNERTGACPKCGRAQCHINIYWKGESYRLFQDVRGIVFSYMSALDQLLAMSRDIRERRFNPVDWQQGKIKERRLDMMLEKWLAQKKEEVESTELSYSTYHSYRSYNDSHIVPSLGKFDVREIRFSDLEEFKDKLPKTLKLKTKRNILNALHAAMRWMWQKGFINEMPPFPVIKGNDATPRIALDIESQYEALNKIPEDHRDVYEFEFETGLRPGEACALKIKDLDQAAGTVRIQRTFTMSRLRESDKEGHKKSIPLSPRAIEIVKKRLQGRFPEDWIFINPVTGSHYTVNRLSEYWKRYTGLLCTHYEGSRHSFCTQISEVADSAAAQDLMRHADRRSTEKYIHARTEYLRDVLMKRGNVVEMRKKKN